MIQRSIAVLLVAVALGFSGCAHKEPVMPPYDPDTKAALETPEAQAYLSVLKEGSQKSRVVALEGVPPRVAAEAVSGVLSKGKNPFIVIYRVSNIGAFLSYVVDRDGGSDYSCDFTGVAAQDYIIREMRTTRISETRPPKKNKPGEIVMQSMVRFTAIRSDIAGRAAEHEKVSILSRDRIRDVVSTMVEKTLQDNKAAIICKAKEKSADTLNTAAVEATVRHYRCLSALSRYKTILESVGKEPNPADVKKNIPECAADESYTVPEGPKNY